MIERQRERIPQLFELLVPLVNTMSAVKPRFREIQQHDLDAIADLLARGFGYRSRDYWMRGLQRQSSRPLPDGAPRYGYLMEHEDRPVGCLLMIFQPKILDGQAVTCCNLSSWYVEPAFRNYAALFASMTQKRKDLLYFNVTPARPTWPILEAQGFKTHCRGLYFSLPVLSRAGQGMQVEAVTPQTIAVAGLSDEEMAMLKRHAGYGCLSLACRSQQVAVPFIFFRLRKRGGIVPLPILQLGYCRTLDDYARCAGALGRYLLGRGTPVVVSDANGTLKDVVGFYTEKYGRKYFKGPHCPRLGDLADTELAVFGM
jgi:hypothetical protein